MRKSRVVVPRIFKKCRPNVRRKTVKLTLDKETYDWYIQHNLSFSKSNQKNLASRSIEFYHDYCQNRKGFLIRILESNFNLCKYLLRRIGRAIQNS